MDLSAIGLPLAPEDPAWLILGALLVGLLTGWAVGYLPARRRASRLRAELDLERELNRERHAAMEKTFAALAAGALKHNNRAFLDLAQQVLGRFHVAATGQMKLGLEGYYLG